MTRYVSQETGLELKSLNRETAVNIKATDRGSQFLEPQQIQCRTCIFKTPREGAIALSPERLNEIIDYLIQGKQHLCHSNFNVACRGGRDLQLKVFFALGFIKEATDDELRAAYQRFLNGQEL